MLFNRSYSMFPFSSMLAPSPDWFVFLSKHSLLNESAEGIKDNGAIDLRLYDVNTRNGNTYALGGSLAKPQVGIARLTETVVASPLSVRFF
ncbi:MAG: hypothetical protein AAGF06_02340 [Pseudomonadota bacterium]